MQHALSPSHLSIAAGDSPTHMQAIVKPTRELVHKQLAKLTALPSAMRSILIEVYTLVEFGGKKRCFANNKHFAMRACCSTKTVTRSLDALVKNGLLSLVLENNDNALRELKPTDKLFAILDGREVFTMDSMSRPLGPGVSRGMDRMSQGSGQAVPHNTVKEEVKEINLLSSRVAELESELEAAYAATQKKDEQVLALEAGLIAVNKKWEDGKAKGRKLYADNTATIADLRAQLDQTPAILAVIKPAKPARPKSTACLMSESFYALVAPFKEALAGTDYAHADLDYYHELISNWSAAKGEKRVDWLATAKGWLLRDSKKNELKLNPNSQLIPSQHDRQEQSARAQRLGLIDEAKRDAAREIVRAYRAQ